MIEEEIELLNLVKKANDIYEINTKDWVTKANTIIESQYKLTLQEQRILLITASKAQPSDLQNPFYHRHYLRRRA